MKTYLITIIVFLQFGTFICSAQTWYTTKDTILSLTDINPGNNSLNFSTYNFSTPVPPTLFDTLNIKFHYCILNSSIEFQVLEHNYAQFDTTQTDTLGFIVSSLLNSTNSVLLSSQNLATINGFKGKEIEIKSNNLVNGNVVRTFSRFYYQKNLMLTFKVASYDTNLSQLISNKNLFFNSIDFPSPIPN
jgi:hypothetical protein